MKYNNRRVKSQLETYTPTKKIEQIKNLSPGVYLFLLLVVIAIITVIQWLLR